jgi:diguanylate cyclase (GGDEF)-like protein/PAS domain S-box-containing protein
LRAANKALETASDEQQLLYDICRIAVEVGGYRFAWVGYAMEDEDKSVRFMAHAGESPEYLDTIRITWDESDTGRGPAGNAIRTLTPHIVQHISDSNEFAPWRHQALQFGYRSVIALPLRWRGNLFGCLVILSVDPDAFDADEAELLGELASSLSYGINALRTGLAHEQASQALRTERDSQEVLRRILSLSLETLSLEEKLDRILELLFDVPWLSLEHKGSVFLVDEGSRQLRLVSRRYLSPLLHELCSTVPFGHCLCGRAAASNELVFCNHIDDKHDNHFEGIQDHGHYCQPIRSATGVLGVLNLYVAAGHQPSPLEARFLEAVADTMAGVIEREQAEMARQRLVTLLEATPDLVTITDTSGKCLYCNDSAQTILGARKSCHSCEKSIFSHYPDKAAATIRDVAYPMAIEAGLWEGELELTTEHALPMPVSLLVMSHRDSHGDVAYLSTIARDIRDRISAEQAAQELAVHEKLFANSIINSLPGIFYLTDLNGRLRRWNHNLEAILGYTSKRLGEMQLNELMSDEARAAMEHSHEVVLRQGSASMEVDLTDHTGAQQPFFITNTLIEHVDSGKGIVGIGIDISYRKQLERELEARATTDILTGAFNRLKMEETLEYELNRSNRYRIPVSITMFDIDHFKQVNDTHGHDVGDEVLKAFAAIARSQLRDVDLLSRWGGEEFMIISSDTALNEMINLAERVRQAITAKPVTSGVNITASFGVGQFIQGESQKELLKRVDDALYRAKAAGRNQVKIAQ